jgi:hypothetical protein
VSFVLPPGHWTVEADSADPAGKRAPVPGPALVAAGAVALLARSAA